MLRLLSDNLWVCDKAFSLLRLEFGNRMTVVRVNNELLLHSPVQFDSRLAEALAVLGEVRYLVAPNLMHDLFISEWRKAYPDVLLFAPSGLAKLTPDIRMDEQGMSALSPSWQFPLTCHGVSGMPRLNETVFLHRPSGTLILTDLAFNIGEAIPFWSRTFFRAYGAYNRFGPTRLIKHLIRDKPAFRRSVATILQWEFDRIILSHGNIVENDGKRRFEEAFGRI